MKTFTTLKSLATQLSNNDSTTNDLLMGQLISDQHRYKIQKYFDNERTYTTLTIGGKAIVLASSPAVGSTTGTLTVAWPDISCQQLVTFGDGEQRTVTFTQGSTTISWATGLYGASYTTTAVIPAGATSATLSTAWTGSTGALTTYFSDGESKSVTYTANSTSITWAGGLTGTVTASIRTYRTNTTITTIGVQAYPIPPQVSKIKNDTITVGQLVYTPAPVQSIQEWTLLNALPYTSDIPNYFYIYQNQVMFWPIPSTSGNVISFNYKGRIPDLSFSDYSTGTLSGIAVGSNAITGSSTSWNTTGDFPLNTDLTFFNLFLKITPPSGDGLWYQIKQFNSDTSLTLVQPVQTAPSATATSYVIGQVPLLQEDFHDMLVYAALAVYYASIVKDEEQFKLFQALEQQRDELLAAYAGTKSVNVDLGAQPIPNNPNLFIYANQQ
jgi:hypothetical protein